MNPTQIEELIKFGFSIFSQVFALFKHPTNPVPVSAAPSITESIHATPGLSAEHKTVAAAAVTAAAKSFSETPQA